MVATVYTPNGIVVATASYDSFHEHLDTEDGIQISPINIEGLTHTYLFYNKYSLTFNGLNSYTIEFEMKNYQSVGTRHHLLWNLCRI